MSLSFAICMGQRAQAISGEWLAPELRMDKPSWLDVNPSLFWDLTNIAFSHVRCNCGVHRNNRQTSPPSGTAWCAGHKQFLRAVEFGKRTRNANGLQNNCKVCARHD